MIDKGKLYRLAEGSTPPYLWQWFKRTALYKKVSARASTFTSYPQPENIAISGGDFAGIILRLNPEGVWQKEMLSGNYDHELFSYLKKQTLTGKVMYDIGAHIGYHSLAFARLVGSTGKVFTFEPNPVNSTRCKEILALNSDLASRISLHEVALGEKVGTTTFLCSSDLEGGSSTGGFVDNATTIWERSVYVDKIAFKEITVPEETIDNLIESGTIAPPDILKIDVEGAEQHVLTGAKNTLAQYHPLVIVEFHSIYSSYACTKILNELGYVDTILKQEPDGRIMIAAHHA